MVWEHCNDTRDSRKVSDVDGLSLYASAGLGLKGYCT